MSFLHNFHPKSILFSLGPIDIHWYGIFIVLGIIAAMFIIGKLAEKYGIKKEDIIDIAFYAIIGGIIGARIYFIFLELPYFLINPINIFKIWHGGLAIHGGILGGLLSVFILSKIKKINFWKLTAIAAPGMALAQAIGRWGNYFNQEVFGKPTNLPWGIPIEPMNRPLEYLSSQYFHPTFLYESIGNLIIFCLLILAHRHLIKNKKMEKYHFMLISSAYLIAYSILRFMLEFLRVDETILVFGIRWPQIMSILIIAAAAAIILLPKLKNNVSLN
jgi:phosphatidylglycerol---prolipoprotein diacylglyceryl transferase